MAIYHNIYIYIHTHHLSNMHLVYERHLLSSYFISLNCHNLQQDQQSWSEIAKCLHQRQLSSTLIEVVTSTLSEPSHHALSSTSFLHHILLRRVGTVHTSGSLY